jgi:hypothetical protein
VTTEPVPPGSLDRFGLSITTASRDPDDPRAGAIYHPTLFAAATPIYFHPMGGSRYLGLFDGYWTAATASRAEAGIYSAHTAVVAPAAAIIDASTGALSRLAGLDGFTMLGEDGAQLISAVGQSRVLYVLVDSGTPQITVWRLDPNDQLVFMRTVACPVSGPVTYDRGLYLDGPYLYLWGSDDTTHEVYTARVFTSRLGVDDWSYQTSAGWTNQPLLAGDGAVLTTAAARATPVAGLHTQGPMSTVVFRGRTYASVTANHDGSYWGQIWCSRTMSEPWTMLKEHVIAATADWLGNNLMLQPQVGLNATALPDGAVAAIPYVLTYAEDTENGEGLRVFWDLLSIPASLV